MIKSILQLIFTALSFPLFVILFSFADLFEVQLALCE